MTTLKVVLVKPSKYAVDGYVERFKTGYMPNATLYHIAGLTPKHINSVQVKTYTIDEYVRDDLEYLSHLKPDPDKNCTTILALVGVQSHQFHRALDLAAYAHKNGIRHCIIGGPHPMTCDTTQFQNRGISFALAEAEVIWQEILNDAIDGELKPVYGLEGRWATKIDGPIVEPPSQRDMERYLTPLLGLYPVRGCPYNCNYCSVIKISGQQLRSSAIENTVKSLKRAKSAGIQFIMFVSDNFNKYPDAPKLLERMLELGLDMPFLCQCDAQIARQPEFISLLGQAGCYEIFIGVESFDKETLRQAKKFHNQPNSYQEIIRLCRKAGIQSHFSNIIGFPSDTEASIKEQSQLIQQLHPSLASFYILTPIPGTEQYDSYMKSGLLVDDNIDRYDATHLTWQHPAISSKEMSELLFRCYIDFYTTLLRSDGLSENHKAMAHAFRYFAKLSMHPMSGGTGKRKIDHVDDYINFRIGHFDIELAPLPKNLELSTADKLMNNNLSWSANT
jgi:hypothetical protein